MKSFPPFGFGIATLTASVALVVAPSCASARESTTPVMPMRSVAAPFDFGTWYTTTDDFTRTFAPTPSAARATTAARAGGRATARARGGARGRREHRGERREVRTKGRSRKLRCDGVRVEKNRIDEAIGGATGRSRVGVVAVGAVGVVAKRHRERGAKLGVVVVLGGRRRGVGDFGARTLTHAQREGLLE